MKIRIRAKNGRKQSPDATARDATKRSRRSDRHPGGRPLDRWAAAAREGESVADRADAQLAGEGARTGDAVPGHDFARLAVSVQTPGIAATGKAAEDAETWAFDPTWRLEPGEPRLSAEHSPSDASADAVVNEGFGQTTAVAVMEPPPADATVATLDDEATAAVDSEASVQALFDQATAEPAAPLPDQQELETRLGQPLGDVELYTGSRAVETLDRLDAEAAARDNQLLVREPSSDTDTLVHELVHVLQSRGGSATREDVVAEESPAEHEARRVAELLALDEGAEAETEPAVVVQEQLSARSIALIRGAALAEPPGTLGSAPDEAFVRSLEPASTRRRPEPSVGPAAVEPGAGPRVPEGETVAGGEEAGITLETAAPPEAGELAAVEARAVEEEAALAEAEDVSGLMAAFAEASPTVKARQANQLGQNAATLAEREGTAFNEEVPEIDAVLNTEVEEPPALGVASPEARDVRLEETLPPPAPEPEVAPTAEPEPYRANDNVASSIARVFGGESEDRARQVGASLGGVQTTDPDIETSPGPPPAVPLEGENDPQRIQNQAGAAVDETRATRDEAQTAVLEGPGPEQVQPTAFEEEHAVGELNVVAVEDVAPVEGPQQYLEMPLPPDVRAGFDQDNQEEMQANLQGARAQVEQATAERDAGREEQVAAAQEEAGRLSEQADQEQRSRVLETRQEIQAERQSTLDAQNQAVADAESGIESRREEDRAAIDQRVADDERTIREDYSRAEEDARAEVQDGERRAADERDRAEREAENESWWDKATSFVRRAFEALTSAIGAIFDAVRSAINDILDAVKEAALALIDLAAAFIKDAIEAFGEFLKSVVDNLLGDIFPGLAAALNELIDSAVDAARAAVDRIAEGLKAGVAALVEGLRAGLNTLLNAFQGAINAALAIAQAALTGDWSGLARKVLEAVLRLAGIDPQQFYALIGQAMDTFHLIIDNPLGFVRNLLDAFLGGVRQFASNILTHLRAGIIAWLTGTLGGAGITLPDRFDLAGVFSLVRQILGLTWERLRAKAVKIIGERAVAMLEFFASYLQTLIVEGWAGLWERIKQDLTTLRDTILNSIKEFIVTRLIMAAITKLATLFNPVGAIVQLVLTAWNIFTFIRDQLQRLFALAQAVVEAISNIARGILGPAMNKVESVLASLLPLALDLLARILGLGNIGAKVREIVERVQQAVDRAIDRLIDRVKSLFRRSGGRAAAETAEEEQEIGEEGWQILPLQMAGQEHRIRAKLDDSRLVVEMASNGFTDFVKDVNASLNAIGERAPQQAPELLDDLREVMLAIQALHKKVRAQQTREQQDTEINTGLESIALRLREIGEEYGIRDLEELAEVSWPQHSDQSVRSDARWKRPIEYVGDPISSASAGRGAEPSDVAGIAILSGYERGHLLAKSLGGPGDWTNISPMTGTTNRGGSGMQKPEDQARFAVYKEDIWPPVMLRYAVKCEYNSHEGLDLYLQNLGAPAGAWEQLYELARDNTQLDVNVIHSAIGGPNLDIDRVRAEYQNIRKRLAWHFLPHTYKVEIEVLKGNPSEIQGFHSIPNHQGTGALV